MHQWRRISHVQGLRYARNEHEQHTPHTVHVQREGIDGKGAKHEKHTLVGVFLVFGGWKMVRGQEHNISSCSCGSKGEDTCRTSETHPLRCVSHVW